MGGRGMSSKAGGILSESDAERIRRLYDFDVDSNEFIEMSNYTGGRKAAEINTALRNNNVTAELQKNIDYIDSHMRPLPKDIEVTRTINDFSGMVPQYANAYEKAIGLSSSEVYDAIKSKNTNGIKHIIGKTIHNKSYTSASYDSNRNAQKGAPVVLKMRVRKGTKAIVTGNRKESELIVHRNYDYKITGVAIKNNSLIVSVSGGK